MFVKFIHVLIISINFSLSLNGKENSIVVNNTIEIIKLEEDSNEQLSIEVKSIYYESNQLDLDTVGKSKLRQVKGFLEDDLILEILIVTYMDLSESKICKGSLSINRGIFLKKQLVEQGISEHRIYLEALVYENLNSSDSFGVNEKESRRADFKFFKD